ncbi:MAG: trypsin-like peptidase domain-containing protein [Clostridia bacterium]|nr:trypsin-like peptidase domain-containing protein [Clostridia bacterium]
MRYYDPDFYGKRPGFLAYLAMGLIGALIGGLIVAVIAPTWGLIPTPQAPRLQGRQADIAPPVAPPASPGEPSPIITIAEKVGPAVVGIKNMSNGGGIFKAHPGIEQGSGSGVLIDEQGFIVTNNHVVEGAEKLVVSLANGKELEGKLIGRDPRTDLAVVKIDPSQAGKFLFARLGDSDKVMVGELAVAIGNPLGEEFARTVTAGIISALNRTVEVGEGQKFTLLQTDAAINPGNSGGALVNNQGEVIGINSVKIINEKVEGMNFAIPINTAKPIIRDLITQGKVIRPWLGILYRGVNINDQAKEQYGLPVNYGIVVDSVVLNGPAAKAGMQDKDILIAFNDKKIATFPDLQQALEKTKVGDNVTVTIVRDKTTKALNIKLGEMPQQTNP